MESKLKDIKNRSHESLGFKRLQSLFDNGEFTEMDSFLKSVDNVFEVTTGFGYVKGRPVYAFSQNIDTNGAPISKSHISKILKVYNMALKVGVPVIGIFDSVGARLEDGNEMLSLYGEWLKIANKISGVVPQISIVLGTCLGTSSMIVGASDFVIMTENSKLGLDVRGEMSSSDFAAENGICHITAHDEGDAIFRAQNIIELIPSNNIENSVNIDLPHYDPNWESDRVIKIFDNNSFIEFQSRFGMSFRIGFARLAGKTVGVVSSNSRYKDGLIDADACSKAARFIRFCDAFSVPLFTFIDSKGFDSLRDASKLSGAYSESTTIKITTIVGQVFGPVYTAIAGKGSNSDVILSWPGSTISMLKPETEAIIMHQSDLVESQDPINDRKKIIDNYKNEQISVFVSAGEGLIDEIMEEEQTRNKLISYLDMMSGKREPTLPKKHSNIQI